MNKSFLNFFTIMFLVLVAIFHFLRMMFGWQIVINNYYLPPWISGIIFIFCVLMIYSFVRIKKTDSPQKIKDLEDIQKES